MNAETSSVNWKKTGWLAGALAAVGGIVALLANLTTIAGWLGYGPESGGEGTTVAAQYVKDCEDDGYTREQCQASRDLDPSPEWTGKLYEQGEGTQDPTGDPDPGGGGDPGPTEGPDPREVYVEECEEDGNPQIDCEFSWEYDPEGVWRGVLYTPYDAYIRECEADGHTFDECDTSWQHDTSTEWSGQLAPAPTPSEYDVYVQECQDYGGYTWEECDGSWYRDPNSYWSGQLY
ncbi:hypothetical protein [Glycomyces albidus]|uniref:Uncharacterized protein n=1 Tax=Glycomyces albidus TaxID=2656774 RepID=A0A6L5G3R8_9ACTN|nr:hypothetical protein [Glycomyces albidus]MQM24033.1 hypothetical protein [Glycomyces albidus]